MKFLNPSISSKIPVLSAVSVAALTVIFAAQMVQAQTDEKNNKYIRQKTDLTDLQKLTQRFQQKFQEDEAGVAAYLQANPGVTRTQIIDGKVHTIVRIGPDGKPEFRVHRDAGVKGGGVVRKNTESAALIKADSLYSGGALGVDITGQGMVAGVWEPGLPRVDHELFVINGVSKITIQQGQATPSDDLSADNVANRNHATHVTGTMVGRPIGNPASDTAGTMAATARGIAHSAIAKNWDAQGDLPEMGVAAADMTTPLLVSNHSYGDANTQTTDLWKYGAYNAEAKDWDALLKAAPMYLPFIAGGNEQMRSGNAAKNGYDIMTGSSASKNAVTVGAVNADKSMSEYSNWGPTDDGRVKPEIVARGTGINSAQAFSAGNPEVSTSAYSGSGGDSSGTSYAAPAAAAGALLLQQYYNSLNTGKYMRASTLKTMIMGTAEDLGQPGPDYQFGYGLMNVEAAARAIKNNSVVTSNVAANDAACAHGAATQTENCQVTLGNSKGALVYEWNANPMADGSAEMNFSVRAKGGGTPVVVNIGWTDDDGVVQTGSQPVDDPTSRMVYDFDVVVRQSGGGFSRAWVLPGMTNRTANATKATNFNFQSNGGPFRQVIIDSPSANQLLTIFVKKKSGSPAATRTLSMVVTGLAEATAVNGACGSASGTTATATAPTANLCATGTATAVAGNGNGKWNWDCNGGAGGTSTTNLTCSAPYASQTLSISANPTTINVGQTSLITASSTSSLAVALASSGNCTLAVTTATGTAAGTCTVTASQAGTGDTGTSRYLAATTNPTASIQVNGTPVATGQVGTPVGNNWQVMSSSFGPANSTPVPGATLPFGQLNLTLNGGVQGTNTSVDVTFTQPIPAGAQFYKFGKRSPTGTQEWYLFSGAVQKNANTVTLTLTDGPGANTGDNDQTANGIINDPFAVIVPPAQGTVAPIPTLGEWAMMALTGLMLLLGIRGISRRKGISNSDFGRAV